MRKLLLIALLLVAVSAPAQDKVNYENVGRTFVTALFAADDAAVVAMMTDQMAKAMPAEGLKGLRAQLAEKAGAFKSIKAIRVEPGPQNYQFSIVMCEFEKSEIGVRVVVDEKGKVGGLQFVPPSS